MTRRDYVTLSGTLKSVRKSTETLYVNASSICDAHALLVADAIAKTDARLDKQRFLKTVHANKTLPMPVLIAAALGEMQTNGMRHALRNANENDPYSPWRS